MHKIAWFGTCRECSPLLMHQVICDCFWYYSLSAADKAITRLAASPIVSNLRLLAVGSRRGLVEVLRVDAALVRLQRFSLTPPTQSLSNAETHITGLIFVPRPSWLLDGKSVSSEFNDATADVIMNDSTTEKDASDPFAAIRPVKRHIGWNADDLLYLRLPNLKQVSITLKYASSTISFWIGPIELEYCANFMRWWSLIKICYASFVKHLNTHI